MRRLLLIAPAELTRDPRARRQAAAALARGWDVLGLSGRISGEEPVPLAGVSVVRVGRSSAAGEGWAGAPVAGPPGRAAAELRGLYRLARLAWRTALLWRGGRRAGALDIVHANDFDTLPAGFLLARRTRARLVYDAHELYSAFDPAPPPIANALGLSLERALARRADAVVTVSDAIADELDRRLRLAARPLVVPNAPPLDPQEPEPPSDGPLRAIYQGGLGPGRPLEDLLPAAEVDGVALTLRLTLSDPGSVRTVLEGRGLGGRVALAEAVAPDRAVDALRGFDVGIVFDRGDSLNSRLAFPNKLFEYLMAGLAVVVPRLPGLAPLVESEGIGLVFKPGAAGLASALATLAADRGRLAEMRMKARRLAVERYNADRSATTLAEAWQASP